MGNKIALLPGDGIGPEVTEAAVKIIDLISNKFNVEVSYETFDIGGGCYEKHGAPLVEETLDGCYNADAVFLGAVGGGHLLARIQIRLHTQSRQKHYATNRKRDLAFEVGDFVYLKVSPMRGLHRFKLRRKLAP